MWFSRSGQIWSIAGVAGATFSALLISPGLGLDACKRAHCISRGRYAPRKSLPPSHDVDGDTLRHGLNMEGGFINASGSRRVSVQ